MVEMPSTGPAGLPRGSGTSSATIGVSSKAKNPSTRFTSSAVRSNSNVPAAIPRMVAAASDQLALQLTIISATNQAMWIHPYGPFTGARNPGGNDASACPRLPAALIPSGSISRMARLFIRNCT